MIKLRVVVKLFTIFFILLIVFSSEAQDSESPVRKPINIIVILDVSDRVSAAKHKNQVDRDKAICKGILEYFERIVSRKLYIGSKDRLAFFIPEQKDFPIGDNLRDRLKLRGGPAPKFIAEKQKVVNAIDELYNLVASQKKFTGSDIWEWFKKSSHRHLKSDFRNYIICLSDGYLDFDRDIIDRRAKRTYMVVERLRKFPDWRSKIENEFGLLPVNQKKFSNHNVSFLMVEMQDREQLDMEIIETYWSIWLASMGIGDPRFSYSLDGPQDTVEEIKSFLSTQ